jgi:hypothetical protein
VVAVIRRGPTDWCHLGRWDLAAGRYEPGAWIRATIYPQKCDLSPDGRWFAASILKPNADWPAGDIYEAVSRLPWLTALAAWNAGTTYTRGIHFADGPGESALGDPDVGDAAPILERYRLDLYRPVQFAVERRRGWVESADTPPRDRGGAWDERRMVTMEKRQPGDGVWTLLVTGGYGGHRTMPAWYGPAEYALSDGADLEMLGGVQWAEWDQWGRLLVATTSGRLQVRDPRGGAMPFDADLTRLRPDPQAPPAWAGEF